MTGDGTRVSLCAGLVNRLPKAVRGIGETLVQGFSPLLSIGRALLGVFKTQNRSWCLGLSVAASHVAWGLYIFTGVSSGLITS